MKSDDVSTCKYMLSVLLAGAKAILGAWGFQYTDLLAFSFVPCICTFFVFTFLMISFLLSEGGDLP